LVGLVLWRLGSIPARQVGDFVQQSVEETAHSQPARGRRRCDLGASSDETFLWDKEKEQTLSSRNGLPCDDVYALAKDNHGSLWLDTRCGFVVIAAAELNRWREHPDVQLNVKTLDVFDGAQPSLTNFRPEISASPDGKLWFANENILQMVDPEHLDRNGIPPPVRVEQIVADRKKYSTRENVHLPVRTKDVEIDYTALSFVVPRKFVSATNLRDTIQIGRTPKSPPGFLHRSATGKLPISCYRQQQ